MLQPIPEELGYLLPTSLVFFGHFFRFLEVIQCFFHLLNQSFLLNCLDGKFLAGYLDISLQYCYLPNKFVLFCLKGCTPDIFFLLASLQFINEFLQVLAFGIGSLYLLLLSQQFLLFLRKLGLAFSHELILLTEKDGELSLFEDGLQFGLVLQIQFRMLEAAPKKLAKLKWIDGGQRQRDIRMVNQGHSMQFICHFSEVAGQVCEFLQVLLVE